VYLQEILRWDNMPKFAYRAKRIDGNIVKGDIEADTEALAIDKLSTQGYFVLSLSSDGTGTKGIHREIPHKRAKIKDLMTFTNQLSELINAGVPLLRGLEILKRQFGEKKDFGIVVGEILADVQGGKSFSNAIEGYGAIFPAVLPALVASGEASGNLDMTLRQASALFEKEHELKSKVKMAMIYPSLVASMGGLTVFFLLSFVIPKISQVFMDFGAALPLPTRILLVVSAIFAKFWWLILGIIGGLFLYYRRMKSIPSQKEIIDNIKLKTPLIKKVVVIAELARFCRVLGMLLQSGVPILQAIDVTLPVLDTELFRKEIKNAQNEIKGGNSLSETISRSEWFPPFVTDILSVGEESGKLDESLLKLAGSYERQLEYVLKITTQLLEPLMILIVGGIVGLIVIGMMLPIFNLNLIIK
jgi:type IV pilus assembly protein PilC